MKRLLMSGLMAWLLSGCIPSNVIYDNSTAMRIFTPCSNREICGIDTYNVTWDNLCDQNISDYPVSYRSKQSVFQSGKAEYVTYRKLSVADQYGGNNK